MDDRRLVSLIERGACGDSDAAAELTASDDAVARAEFERARKESAVMEASADRAVGGADLEGLRGEVIDRALREGRHARRWMIGLPAVITLFVMVSLAFDEDVAVEDVRRGLLMVVFGGGGVSLLVWLWWRRFRLRAVRALEGGAEGLRAWRAWDLRVAARSIRFDLVVLSVFGLLIGIGSVNAFRDGAWATGSVMGLFSAWLWLDWFRRLAEWLGERRSDG